jgi:hypothetical protein
MFHPITKFRNPLVIRLLALWRGQASMDEIGRRVLSIPEQDKIRPKKSLDGVKVRVKTRLKHTHTDIYNHIYIDLTLPHFQINLASRYDAKVVPFQKWTWRLHCEIQNCCSQLIKRTSTQNSEGISRLFTFVCPVYNHI